ncbi:MAG: PASTA domain-containing protein [Bacteroidetes bacterium]|nr:MAG: PASTA domain-containing protein [Bacteroidota bacterium]
MIKVLKSKPLWINLIAMLVFLALVVWGVDKFLDSVTRHGESKYVPSLYGLQVEEAGNLLEELDLRYEILDSLYDENFPKNAVIEQIPDSGCLVKEERKIYIRINRGDVPMVQMPDLEDKNIKQALFILESVGLKIGHIDTVEDIAEDAVIKQLYKGNVIRVNTEIPRGSVINLIIGNGGKQAAEKVPVPDLDGSTLNEARIILGAMGLKLGEVYTTGKISDSSQATVISQSPSYSSDLMLYRGSSINVTIK